MSKDVVVVTITNQLAAGADLRDATRGDWLIAASTAERLAYIVGVSKGAVHAVYALDGFDIIQGPGGKERVRFTVTDTARTWVGEVPRMYGAFVLRDSAQTLDPGPEPEPEPETFAPEPEPTITAASTASTPERPGDATHRATRGPERAESGESLRVIQFPHPGFEHSVKDCLTGAVPEGELARAVKRHRQEGPAACVAHQHEKPWKPGKVHHDRKYLVAPGSVMSDPAGPIETDVELGFWGEWEPPSRWELVDPAPPRTAATRNTRPRVRHYPLLPATSPPLPLQNTDPLVFGDRFLYTNCRMRLAPMQDMPAGSIVMFGRTGTVEGRWVFGLDTCFVVEQRHPRSSVAEGEPLPYGQDLLTDVVWRPLRGDETRQWDTTRYYTARMASDGTDRPFSFFPAVRNLERPAGFARPILEPTGLLKDLIKPKMAMAVRTREFADASDAAEIWTEIVERVLAQGCELGVHARPPERGTR